MKMVLNNIKTMIGFFVLTLISILFVFLVLILVNNNEVRIIEKMEDMVYQEISYQFVSDNLIREAKTDEEISVILLNYTHLTLNVPDDTLPMTHSPWERMVRGISWCDQQAGVLATLLGKQSIEAEWIGLQNKEGISPHSVIRIFLDGKWRIMDPLHGLVYRTKKNELATMENICLDQSIVLENPKIIEFKKYSERNFNEFAEIYCYEPIKKELVTRIKQGIYKKIRWFIKKIVPSNKSFVFSFQDYYLTRKMNSIQKEDYKLYFKARNYHLYNRLDLAKKQYTKLIKLFPNSEFVDESLLFLGSIYCQYEDKLKGIDYLNEAIQRFPSSNWKYIIFYHLGKCYEDIGEFEKAEENYLKSAHRDILDSAWRLEEIRNKIMKNITEGGKKFAE